MEQGMGGTSAKTRDIPIEDIRTDGGTQIRERIDDDTVDEYAAKVKDGVEFPPCDVFHDGSDYWCADGFHRILAHKRCKCDTITCIVHKGTIADAIKFACEANNRHGLPLKPGDRKRAVELMLKHWGRMSQVEIAASVGVSHQFVSKTASCNQLQDRPESVTTTRNGKTYEMKTGNIGRKSNEDAAPATPEPDRQDDHETDPDAETVKSNQSVVECEDCGRLMPGDGGACPQCKAKPKKTSKVEDEFEQPEFIEIAVSDLLTVEAEAERMVKASSKPWSQISPVEIKGIAEHVLAMVSEIINRGGYRRRS